MTVGLIAALPAELRCLARQIGAFNTPIPINPKLVGLVSGMGPERAGRAAQSLIEANITALVSWGTACALDPALRPGDLVLADIVIAGDGRRFTPDPEWRSRLSAALIEAGLTVHTGPLAETAGRLDSTRTKSALAARTGALAADMETAAIMKVACSARRPCLAIRAISDTATMALPATVLDQIDAYGRPLWQPFLYEIVRSPAQLSRLVRLAAAMYAATVSLARAARAAENALQTSGRE